MPLSQWILFAIVVVALAAIAWLLYERNRTKHLRAHFGPEYDRHVSEVGNRRRAEAELARSEDRVRKATIRLLSESEQARFREEWKLCQARFVDDPAGALVDADRILIDIMRIRGYRVDDPINRVTDISAAYPNHSAELREANDIVMSHRRGNASTEDLRRAFIQFRSLFDEILGGKNGKLERAS